jgi:hypothetical protein
MFIAQGGKALIFPRQPGEFLGFSIAPAVISKVDSVPDWKVCRGLSLSDFYLKTDFAGNLLTGGKTAVGLDGVLGRYRGGDGEAILLQLVPDMLNADKFDYYRYASWRLTRAVSQLLTNLGASFAADDQFFLPRKIGAVARDIPLPLEWKAEFELKVDGTNSKSARLTDPVNRGLQKGWHKTDFDDATWRPLKPGSYWEAQGSYWNGMNGVVWYRTRVFVPKGMQGKSLVLNLGSIDDMDTSYVNGVEVGRTNKQNDPTYWSTKRNYPLPENLIKYGAMNTIAVRVFDNFGNGGMYSDPDELKIAIRREKAPELYDLYVSGFDNDWADGDDPYRYWRW